MQLAQIKVVTIMGNTTLNIVILMLYHDYVVLGHTLPQGFKTGAGALLRSQVDVLPWIPDQDTQNGWGSDWKTDDGRQDQEDEAPRLYDR